MNMSDGNSNSRLSSSLTVIGAGLTYFRTVKSFFFRICDGNGLAGRPPRICEQILSPGE